MSGSLSQLYLSDPNLAVALRRQQQAQGLVNQSLDASPTTWAGALARLVQAYTGNRNLGRADDQIKGIADQRDQEFRNFNSDLPQVAGTPPASVPAPVVGAAPGASGDYVARVGRTEGTGQNPRSSANGYYQFTNGTWMEFARANPQLFPNMDPAQILAQRDNEPVARQATEWLAGRNAPVLQAAGVEPTDGAKGLAHFLGAKPAAAVWNADPNAPIESVLATVLPPAQVQAYISANPNLVGKTAGQVAAPYRAWDRPTGAPTTVASAPPPGTPASDAGGPPAAAPPVAPPSGAGPDAPSGPPRASPLADVYLQQAMALQRKAQQAAASNNPRIQAQAPVLMQQAQLYAGLAKEKPKTNVLRPGGMLVDDQGRVIARAPDDTGPLNVIQDGVDEKGNPRWRYATRPQAVGQPAPTPGPLVTVDQRGANAEAQERGASLAKQAAVLRDEAAAAAGTIDQVRQLRNIGAETGRLAPAQEIIGGALDALGVKGTDAVRKATTLQQFNGALSGLVLGAQLAQKGVQTEGDANRMREQYAKATNTMDANDFLMRATEAQATRKMEQHDFYENWFAQHKTYDGASQGWNKFIREVPLTVRGAEGVEFFNEFRDILRNKGRSDDQIIAAWKSRAK